MQTSIYGVNGLDDKTLNAVQALEEKTGLCLIAMQKINVEADNLKPSDMDAIQKLEDELGVTLLAVRPN